MELIISKLQELENLIITSGQKKVLTMDEVSKYTGLSKSYLYKLTSSKQIPFYKPNGKTIFFEREELENWLLQNRAKTTTEIDEEASTFVTLKKRR